MPGPVQQRNWMNTPALMALAPDPGWLSMGPSVMTDGAVPGGLFLDMAGDAPTHVGPAPERIPFLDDAHGLH